MLRACVTGASGYIGSWVTLRLLEEGYIVNATVRSLDNKNKISHLEKMQSKFSNLHLFEADLLKPETFLPAFEGCEVVFHTASPVIIMNVKDPQHTLIEPALKGTEAVLNAVNQTPTVNKVVLTSSIAAVAGGLSKGSAPGGKYNEKDWNEKPDHPYYLSKTLAEKKAWEMANAQTRWSLTTIQPGLVLGPSLSKRIEGMSVGFFRDLLIGKYPVMAPDFMFSCVDVREVADAHVRAFKKGEGRYIVVAESISLLTIARELKKLSKRWYVPFIKAPNWFLMLLGPLFGIDKSFLDKNLGRKVEFDHSRSLSLGLSYRPMEETITDHYYQLKDDELI